MIATYQLHKILTIYTFNIASPNSKQHVEHTLFTEIFYDYMSSAFIKTPCRVSRNIVCLEDSILTLVKIYGGLDSVD